MGEGWVVPPGILLGRASSIAAFCCRTKSKPTATSHFFPSLRPLLHLEWWADDTIYHNLAID